MKLTIRLVLILVSLGIVWASTHDETDLQPRSYEDEILNDEFEHAIVKRASSRTCYYGTTRYRSTLKPRSYLQLYYVKVYYRTCWFNLCKRSRNVARYRYYRAYYYARTSYTAYTYYTCYNGATCGSRCNCRSGWTGTYCNIDINECSRINTCGSLERCVNTQGSYSCNCKTGYRRVGRSCVDVNECSRSPCRRSNEACINTVGSYRCSCRTGYRRSGYRCVDINECSSYNGRCSHYCYNTAGSFYCRCRTGYRLYSGKNCSDINECTLNIDRCNQLCTNTAGSYRCSCRSGYYLSNAYTCTLVRFSVALSGYALSSSAIRLTWRITFSPSSQSTSLTSSLYRRDLSYSTTTYRLFNTRSVSAITVRNIRLLPYRNYRFYIRTVGSATLTYSNYVTVRTREAKPSSGPRTVGGTTLSSSRIRVSWTAPSSQTQNGILRYYYILYKTSQQRQSGARGSELRVSASATSYTLTGLSAYTEYWLGVAAATSVGKGPYTSKSTAVRTSESRPTAAPRLYYASKTSTSITVQLRPPSNTALINGIITYYLVAVSGVNIDTGTRYIRVTPPSANKLSPVYGRLSPLQESVSYRIRAYVYTRAGNGPYSSFTISTLSSAPSNTPQNIVFTSVRTTSLSLRWSAPPLIDQNGVITGYRLTYRGASVDTRSRTISVTNTYATLSNLEEGSAYTIDVLARNSAGNGPSTVVNRTTLEIAPSGPPKDFVVRSNSPTTLSVSWQAPSAEKQNGIINGFQIEIVGRAHDSNTYLVNLTENIRSHTIYRLEEGHSYQVTIRARNRVGFSPATNAIIISTRESVPGTPPQTSKGVQGTTWISLSWNPPLIAEQNGNITKYEIEYSGTSVDRNNGSFYITELTSNISNLEQYEFYRIRIRAFTKIGPGPFSPQLAIRTLQEVPSAPPRGVEANVVSSTQIILRWLSPPLKDQNGLLTGYEVKIVSDYNSYNQKYTLGGTNSQYRFTNLHPYVNYTVQVRAHTTPGSGPYSSAITVETRQAAPSGTPLSIESATWQTIISLQWQPPVASEQNGIITGYLVKYRGLILDIIMKNLTTSNTAANLNNLVPGVDYQMSVCAYTSVGVGPCLTVTNTTVSIPPSESPENVTVKASGSTSLVISWMPPAIMNQNGRITGYKIVVVGRGHDSSVRRITVSPSLRSFSINSLEEAHYYDVSISTENDGGNGPYTQNYSIITNEDAPASAPQNVHGISNQTSIFILWNAPPAPDHNGEITKYELLYKGTTTDTNTNYSIYETELRAIISHLHVNEIYQIQIRAFTSFGPGPYSTVVLIKTLESRPTAAPQRVNLISDSDTQITVEWEDPPLVDQNGVLTGFDLSIASEDNSYQDEISVTAPRQIYSFTGLHPYTKYLVKVRATTQPGPGPYSAELMISTQQSAPTGSPRNVQVDISPNTLSLVWEAPDATVQNGIIVGYQITYKGTVVDMNETTINTPNNTLTISNLEEGVEYSVSVCAMTVAIGPCVQWTNYTTEAIPTGFPINLQIQAITPTAITISWDAPALALQNGMITGYEVIAVGQQHDNTAYKTDLDENTLSYTFESLEESHAYNVKIRARNAVGFGPFTSIITVITLEAATGAAPLNLTSNSTETSITLHWKPPLIQHHNGILRYYEIEYYSTSDFLSMVHKLANVSASQDYMTIDNLQEYAEYQFKIRAYTSVGPGPYSPEITVTTKHSQPSSPPTDLQAVDLSATQIQVTWDPPSAIDQNGPITQYQIVVSLPSSPLTDTTYTTSQTIYTIQGLRPYTLYSIQIRADNSIGAGPYTASVTATTRQAIPAAPPTHLTLVSITHTSANISWTSPALDTLNGPLQSYTLNVTDIQTSSSFSQTSTSSQTHTLLDNLTPYTRYSLVVAAVNTQGIGPYTTALYFSTLQSSPTQPPTITQITDNSPHSILLQWDTIAAQFQNGPILSYTVNITSEADNSFISSLTVQHPTTSATINNLHAYTDYTLSVSGSNAAGTSPPTYDSHTTEEDTPAGPPTSLSADPSSTVITLSWQPPDASLRNGPIVEYSVRFQSSNYTTNMTEYTVTGLEEFKEFEWSVAAWTSIGRGPYSQTLSVSTLANPPSAPPQNVTARALSYQSISVSWDPIPSIHQNGIILKYIVYFQGEKFDLSEGKVVESTNTTSAILIHLKPYESYKITVVAENSQGSSPRSAPLIVVTFEGTPSVAPTGFTAHYTSPTSISASWTAIPSHEQNGFLTNYEIVYHGSKFDVAHTKYETPGNVTTATLTELHPNVQYTMLVRGITDVGNGPNSPSIKILLPESKPSSAPEINQINVVSQTSIYVAWEGIGPSGSNGNIIAYGVKYSRKVSALKETNPEFYQNSSQVTLNVTLNGLEIGTMYEISVRGYTIVGPGPSSLILSGTTAPRLIQCYNYYNQYFHNPCSNNGTCLSGGSIPYVCQCLPGFTDPVCFTDINDCETNQCSKWSECIDKVNGYTCKCDAGFSGEYCDDNIVCDNNDCQNGTCVEGIGAYTCSCFPNYNGTYCQFYNTCASSPCNHGSCLWENNSYNCTCDIGYEGTHCEINTDDCTDNACENGAECIDGINEYTCDCSEGFKGTYCEIKTSATTCESQELVGFKWQETNIGVSVTLPCKDAMQDLTGVATRKCSKGGDWEKLDVSNCTRPTYQELEIEFTDYIEQTPELPSVVAEALSNRLEEKICINQSVSSGESSPTFYPYEITVITKVLAELIKSIENRNKSNQAEMVPMLTPRILCVISYLVDLRNLKMFTNTNTDVKSVVISELIEKLAKLNAQNYDTSTTVEHLTFSHDNIQMFVVPLTNKQSATIPDYKLSAVKDTTLYPDSVHIPESEVTQLFSNAEGNTPVISLVFSRYLGEAMGMQHVNPTFGSGSIGTRVISLQSNMGERLTFKKPITLKYWIFPPYNTTHEAMCVSWDGDNLTGEGMHVASRDENTITCASNHATSFAILLSSEIVRPIIPPENDFVTRIVTFILAFISLVSLIVSVIMLLLLGKTLLKSDLFLIHFNLGIAQIFALIFCVLGTQRIHSLISQPISCKIFSISFQYFTFASLSWSFCNAVQIIYMLYAKVKLRRTIVIMLGIGWLLPAVIVGPVAGIKWHNYGVTDEYCWLSEDSFTFWLIAGPILGMNLITIIMSLFTVGRISISKPKTEWYVDARNAVFGLLLMTVVLAVPWAISVVDSFVQFQFYKWSFATIYTLQGMVFLIFYAIGNISVRTKLFKMKRKSDIDTPNQNQRRSSQGGRTSVSNVLHYPINPVAESDFVNPLYNIQTVDCGEIAKEECLDGDRDRGAQPGKFIENDYKTKQDTILPHSKDSQSMEKLQAEDNPYMEIYENDHLNPFIGIEKDKDVHGETEMIKINPFTAKPVEELYSLPKHIHSKPSIFVNENTECPTLTPSEKNASVVDLKAKLSSESLTNTPAPNTTSDSIYDIPTYDQCQAELASTESYVNLGLENTRCCELPLEKLDTCIDNPCYQSVAGSGNFRADRISSEDSDSEAEA